MIQLLPSLGSVFAFLWVALLAGVACAIAIWAARQNDRQSDVVAHLTRRPAPSSRIEPPMTVQLMRQKMGTIDEMSPHAVDCFDRDIPFVEFGGSNPST